MTVNCLDFKMALQSFFFWERALQSFSFMKCHCKVTIFINMPLTYGFRSYWTKVSVSYLITTFLLRHLLTRTPCCLCRLWSTMRSLPHPIHQVRASLHEYVLSHMMCVARMSHMAKCNALKEVTPWVWRLRRQESRTRKPKRRRDMKRTIGRNKKDWRGHKCPIWGKFGQRRLLMQQHYISIYRSRNTG
jgi:hypothetical protein